MRNIQLNDVYNQKSVEELKQMRNHLRTYAKLLVRYNAKDIDTTHLCIEHEYYSKGLRTGMDIIYNDMVEEIKFLDNLIKTKKQK